MSDSRVPSLKKVMSFMREGHMDEVDYALAKGLLILKERQKVHAPVKKAVKPRPKQTNGPVDRVSAETI